MCDIRFFSTYSVVCFLETLQIYNTRLLYINRYRYKIELKITAKIR